MSEGFAPVDDAEYVLRRIPDSQNWGPTPEAPYPSNYAFKPHQKRDQTGLSVFREKYITPRQLGARGRKGKRYWIARVSVAALRKIGLSVEPRPNEWDGPGHAEIPEIRSDNRDSPQVSEWTVQIAQNLCTVEGPFVGETE